MAITKCKHCDINLRYPSAAIYIQCPKCERSLLPNKEYCYANCIKCRELLKISTRYKCIICPKCEATMNVSNDPMDRPIKRKKDPGAPRQASNAYMIFCKEERSRVKLQRPDLPFGKIGAQLGQIWRRMSLSQKAPYESKAQADRERFRRETDEYYRRKLRPAAAGAASQRRKSWIHNNIVTAFMTNQTYEKKSSAVLTPCL